MKRTDYKMLEKLIYLDSAAGTLKPKQVIAAGSDFYNNFSLNPHSLESQLGNQVFQKIVETRTLVAELINADKDEIIFNSGTTMGVNTLAAILKPFVNEGDEILLSYLNHSSMIVPWMNLAQTQKAKIVFSNNITADITTKTKIIALAQINNTIDHKTNMRELKQICVAKKILLINDAAQAVAHEKVDLADADAIIFSANKLYGPTGLGILAINKQLLKKLHPSQHGGGSIAFIDENKYIVHEGFTGFEAGTPNTAAIFMFNQSLKYLKEIKLENIFNHIKGIAQYAYQELQKLENLEMYSQKGDFNIIFNLKGYNSQDVVSYLGRNNIILRSGQLCSKLITKVLNVDSVIRVSLGMYNNKKDIDALIIKIKKGGDFLEFI